MTTAYSDPNSDVSFLWSGGAAPRYARINSATRQPTAGDSTTYIEATTSATKTCEFGMTDPGVTGTVTAVSLWLWYSDKNGPFVLTSKIYIAGGYTSTGTVTSSADQTPEWLSITWSSLSHDASTAFTAAKTHFLSDTLGGPTYQRVGDAYWEITYTASASGQATVKRFGGCTECHNLGIGVWRTVDHNQEFKPHRRSRILVPAYLQGA